MSFQRLAQITVAIIFSISAGFIVRDNLTQDSCSINALNAVLDGGELILAADCVLMVSPAAVITGDVYIEGGILHSSGVDRVLIVEAGARLVLKNTAVLSGSIQIDPAYGGGIYNAGELLIDNTRIAANSAEQGGGIYNTGQLFIIRSTIARNQAREGGGIYNRGFITIQNSIIDGNQVRSVSNYGGYGAGIVNKGAMGIANSQIINNRGDGEGIGIDTSGTLVIRQSVIMGNQCTSADCRATGLLRFEGSVDARHNYWGSPDGPSEEGDGSGDGIVGIRPAAYQPFLTEMPDAISN